MDDARTDQPVKEDISLQQDEDTTANGSVAGTPESKKEKEGHDPKSSASSPKKKKRKSLKCRKHKDAKTSSSNKKGKVKEESSDSDDSSDSDSVAESDSESDSSSEDDRRRRRERKKKAAKRKAKAKKHKRSKREVSSDESSSDSEDDSSASDTESEVEVTRRSRRNRRTRRSHRRRHNSPAYDDDLSDDPLDPVIDDTNSLATIQAQIDALKLQLLASKRRVSRRKSIAIDESSTEPDTRQKSRRRKDRRRKNKKGSTLEYKRVDQLWDSTIHDYKLTESAEQQVDEFDEYIFNVRRKFNWENKYTHTVVDIKSKFLRDALQEIMKDVKSASLVEEEPSLDPNMLFLYLDEIKTYRKKVLKARLKKEKKKKQKKRTSLQIAHLKVLENYINEDYAETKKTLYPMLEAGNITFDLLWALFKPNSLAFTTTYGSADDPRCFKVDYANKESSFMRGEWYSIEGRYLEYDGKSFGLGEFEVDVDIFKGPRKITSLATYPLSFHKNADELKKQLVERGKKFVTLQGMQYKFHKGLAFHKKKKMIAKVNINGRIMIDPAIFRRINPNYPISMFAPKHQALFSDDDDEDSCSDCCGSGSDDEGGGAAGRHGGEREPEERTKIRVIRDRDNKIHVVEVPVDADGTELQIENMDKLAKDDSEKLEAHNFTEEELLIASPVVLGFAFSEKLWLEFSLSGVKEIEWNEGAFSSLVLPHNQKSIVKGMVSSHKFNAAKTIDDVVQGKGRGLVFVLHGPPGVGKTLTAEGIAEFLKCPLYSVSAGELGTDSRMLEHELQKIMDIAHSWGAVLLLDEADVFLEKREVHDIHRNALVSIFLRLLEYFQGILFLTTNRVETFDDAFQSRIHMPLRYGELTPKAKKEIWKTFVEKVRECEGMEIAPFTEEQYTKLARNNLNGRQIKNAVRTAQSLALSEEQTFSMEHIKRVLEVAEDFDHDLKGGTGYIDAMRSYT